MVKTCSPTVRLIDQIGASQLNMTFKLGSMIAILLLSKLPVEGKYAEHHKHAWPVGGHLCNNQVRQVGMTEWSKSSCSRGCGFDPRS